MNRVQASQLVPSMFTSHAELDWLRIPSAWAEPKRRLVYELLQLRDGRLTASDEGPIGPPRREASWMFLYAAEELDGLSSRRWCRTSFLAPKFRARFGALCVGRHA